jgi:uncharacterized damage-inducible protein DinB
MAHRKTPCGALVLFLALAGGSLAAQDTGPNATPAALRALYLADMAEVQEKVLGLADAFPADKFAWRPAPGVRSVSEVLMHIAAEHYVYLPRSVGAGPPASLNMGTGREISPNLEKVTDKAEVMRHVREAFAYQKSVLEGADAKLATGKVMVFGKESTVAGLFNVFIADQHEHLGQLIAYARMNGVVPPWSKKGS